MFLIQGVELDHEPFKHGNGKEQIIFFGCPDSTFEHANAPSNQGTTTPSDSPSTMSSDRPSVLPSKKPL